MQSTLSVNFSLRILLLIGLQGFVFCDAFRELYIRACCSPLLFTYTHFFNIDWARDAINRKSTTGFYVFLETHLFLRKEKNKKLLSGPQPKPSIQLQPPLQLHQFSYNAYLQIYDFTFWELTQIQDFTFCSYSHALQ